MAVFCILPHAEFEPNDHWEDTPHFSDPIRSGIFPFKKCLQFDKNLLKTVISFESLTESANQIARFCQIIETLFQEIFIKFHL